MSSSHGGNANTNNEKKPAGQQHVHGQPELVRLLAIHCLAMAVRQNAKWGDGSYKRPMSMPVADAEEDEDGFYARSMLEVTRNISRLTHERCLGAMVEDVKNWHDGEERESKGKVEWVLKLRWDEELKHLLVAGEDTDDNSGAVIDDGASMPRRITPSHIRGEAYELLCAILFKCKESRPIFLNNYYCGSRIRRTRRTHYDDDDDDDEAHGGDFSDQNVDDNNQNNDLISNNIECRVKHVFLSEKKFEETSELQWCDNANAWKGFIDDSNGTLKRYLEQRNVEEPLLGDILKILKKNVEDDIGFDILVELCEVEQPDNAHFVLAQCKYRSDETAEVSMAEYVGKYYEVANLFDKVHRASPNSGQGEDAPSPILVPFFWMSTQAKPDTMNYFTHLCRDGRIHFYGNASLQYDEGVCNLVKNISAEVEKWKHQYVSAQEERAMFAMIPKQPRNPRDYQSDAIDATVQYCMEKEEVFPVYASVIMATGSGKTLTSLLCVRELEDRLQERFLREEMAASMHFSPMIRLVLQNAHEWLAEEIALIHDGNFMIYYCVCSLKEKHSVALSGCTSVRLISASAFLNVFKYHKSKKTLHRCRFFSTYQGGKLLRSVCRRINIELYNRDPSAVLFGITVRDEAHCAVGKGSRSHSASLYVPTCIGLSFTASPKYVYVHLEHIFPDHFSGEKNDHLEAVQTYSSLNDAFLFPQVDATTCPPEVNNQGLIEKYESVLWDPVDLLSENMLFSVNQEEDRPAIQGEYNWAYFQDMAIYQSRGIVIFYINDERVAYKDGNIDCYDLMLDEYGDPIYFGVVGTLDCSSLKHNTLCFGVNRSLTILYKVHGTRAGFSIHDMTGLGPNNRVGPIVHSLSYFDCMEKNSLAKPRLLMLQRRPVEFEEYSKYKVKDKKHLNSIFGKKIESGQDGESVEKYTSMSKLNWNLTIGGNVLKGTAHHFRSMKMLLDCFLDDQAPIKTAIVFCGDTKESKLCKAIFDAMLAKALHDTPEEKAKYFVAVVFSSDNSADGEDEIADMSYEEQQNTISRFCQAEKGVLFNVKLVGIGVDVPAIDAAMIIPPGKSPSSITQKIGRALRKDPKNPNKIATILVPSWSAHGEPATDTDDCNSLMTPLMTNQDIAMTPRKSDPRITSIMELEGITPPTTPLSSCLDSVGTTDTVLQDDDKSPTWKVPILNMYEDKFLLQVRVVDAMVNENIPMITSFTHASLTKEKESSRAEVDKVTKGKAIMAELVEKKSEFLDPVYDEYFSEFLLSVWKTEEVEINGKRRDVRPEIDPNAANRDNRSKACLMVAFIAAVHHELEGADERKSLFWYKNGTPFKNRLKLEDLRNNKDTYDWSLFLFETFDEFESAILTGKDKKSFVTIEKLRNSYNQKAPEAKDALLKQLFDSLDIDFNSAEPTYTRFLAASCAEMADYSLLSTEQRMALAKDPVDFKQFTLDKFSAKSFADIKAAIKDLLDTDKWKAAAKLTTISKSKMSGKVTGSKRPCTTRDSSGAAAGGVGIDDEAQSPEFLNPHRNNNDVEMQDRPPVARSLLSPFGDVDQ